MGTLELCEKYFDTRDIYKLFEIEKDAPTKDIKKAYYKLSLQVHPDRVEDKEKEKATEKFKLLSKLYQVLSDKDKRALYDERGIIDDDDDVEGKLTSWLELWRKIFKPLTTEDITNYQKEYIGSELERNDIKKAYLSGKGCINAMMNEVPFMQVADEPRIQDIVKEMINANEVPEYKIFTHEPAAKRKRRHKKYARESKEAEELKKELELKNNNNLEQAIMARQKSRESGFNNLMDKLLEKYGSEDDTDCFDFEKLDKSAKKKKKPPASKGKAGTSKLNTVKNGRIKKNKKA